MKDDVDGHRRNPKSQTAADQNQAQQTRTQEPLWHGIVVTSPNSHRLPNYILLTFRDLYLFLEELVYV